jgi:hypothetical protein
MNSTLAGFSERMVTQIFNYKKRGEKRRVTKNKSD